MSAAAPEMVTLAAARRAAQRACDQGQDMMAVEIGDLLKDLIDGGATDSVIVDAVRETVIARIEVGLSPETWYR